jgi:signal transduction histidine kinase/CheY-like chemotaxis protein
LPEHKINILIIGAGTRGRLFINLLHKSRKAHIVGVVDRKTKKAPGIKLAKELGIPIGTDYKEFINKEDLNEILNLTGSEKVQEELLRLKPDGVELIGGHSVELICDVLEGLLWELQEAEKMATFGNLYNVTTKGAQEIHKILIALVDFANFLESRIEKDDLLNAYATEILTLAEKAAKLTRSLYIFCPPIAIEHLEALNLNEIIRDIETLLLGIIGKGIELSNNLTDKNLTVMADINEIQQVLLNLVANARDVMPDGGCLTITTNLVRFYNEFIKTEGFTISGEFAVISVKDTGKGMDEKTKEQIFEPFFTTKEIGKATGLGLCVVHSLIQKHGGHVQVYSELGKGTVFELFLPLMNSTIKIVKESVLIAEDNVLVRELIKEVLTGSGYVVFEAKDGEEAIKEVQEHSNKIQLLILNVSLPKKNGKEVHDAIKKIQPGIRAIFISEYHTDTIHEKGIMDEEVPFVSKPILPNVLLRKVRDVLDKRDAK